jgi:hypothetical protein
MPTFKLYYEDKEQEAKELVLKQIADGWQYKSICDYWHALGYDYFFVRAITKDFFINAK